MQEGIVHPSQMAGDGRVSSRHADCPKNGLGTRLSSMNDPMLPNRAHGTAVRQAGAAQR